MAAEATEQVQAELFNRSGPLHRTSIRSSRTRLPFNTSQRRSRTATVSQVSSLIDSRHIINSFVQQGLITGGFVQVTANESYLKENAPTNNLNPGVAPVVQITVRHSLLQGFGVAVNRRFITVAEKQVGASRETFRSQLLNLVASVLNLYWDLVADDDDLKVRQRALEAAQKFREDTRKQIELGAIARVERLRPEADYSARRQELEISQATVRQQENLLKTAMSKNGLEDPLIDAVEIVPLDHVEVPEQDDLPGLRALLARALAKRPDVALAKISDETGEILALGTINTLLPYSAGRCMLPGMPAKRAFLSRAIHPILNSWAALELH